MNAIAGPRSRCPSRYRKSLTISPSVSRYQSSAARNRVVPSTTWPSRSISAARRAGRWVALTRAGSARSSAAAGRARAAPGSSGTPWTTRTGNPLGSRSRTAWPPQCAVTVPPVPRASRSRSSRAAAWKAAPANRARGPRRTTRHGGAACRPRSTSVSGVRSATVKPKSARNRSAAVQVRLLELQPRQPGHLDQRIRDRPGCSPGSAPASLCSERCGSPTWPARPGASVRLSCAITTDSFASQVFCHRLISYEINNQL